MRLATDLKPLSIDYPSSKKIPKNLVNTAQGKNFRPSQKKQPFREQFASEKHPHKIRHIHYQSGKIKGRPATRYYLDKRIARIAYNQPSDPFAKDLMKTIPPRVSFPPNTVSSNLARNLREYALKWIVDQLLGSLKYMVFDEPILDGVNPDCLALPISQSHQILSLDTKVNDSEGELADVELKNALFIELKAYHGTTIVGEKEVLQAFNYAAKGGKAMLITTGTLGNFDTFKILEPQSTGSDQKVLSPNIEKLENKGYDPSRYQKFVKAVKKKFRKLIGKIDLSVSQDSYDTRGIYISAGSKLDKIYKYTSDWPEKITFERLTTPEGILSFIKSPTKLGLVDPLAFEDLLRSRKLTTAAELFKRLYQVYIEEIIINPTLLYPQEQQPFYLSRR